jgi:hypothetical protein
LTRGVLYLVFVVAVIVAVFFSAWGAMVRFVRFELKSAS